MKRKSALNGVDVVTKRKSDNDSMQLDQQKDRENAGWGMQLTNMDVVASSETTMKTFPCLSFHQGQNNPENPIHTQK
jgi:hypothetical protein